MLAPGLVPEVCSSHSVIGGGETLFDEDVLITNAIVAIDRVPGPTACTAAARMLATCPGRTE